MQPASKPPFRQRLVRWWQVFRYQLPPDFDAAEYLRLNPDVANAKADPVRHFVEFGRQEKRSWRAGLPRGFDPQEYLSLNPDLAEANVDPVEHFLGFGRAERRAWKRDLPRHFDPDEYLSLNPDIAEAHGDLAAHFIAFGRKEGRRWARDLPQDFDPAEYLRLNPDVAESEADPAQHFLEFGRSEGRRWIADLPSDFDPAEYLRLNPDVAKAGVDPVEHFRAFGRREGRRWTRDLARREFAPSANLRRAANGKIRPDVAWATGSLVSTAMLVESYGDINIISYLSRFWAVPQALGPVDFANEAARSHPEITSAATRDELIAQLDEAKGKSGSAADELGAIARDAGKRTGQSVASVDLPLSITAVETLHEYARVAGAQRLFNDVIPQFRKTEMGFPALDALRNRKVESPGRPAGVPAEPVAGRGSALAGDDMARVRNPRVPQQEIAEHTRAKVVDAKKLVSVVIPYFRKKSTILSCLEGLRNQNYELCSRDDIEIIIVDDGTSEEAIHDLLPDDVHYVWQKKIKDGLSSAKNTGAKLSSGRYIVFVDPDVVVARHYLDSMLRGFSKFGDRTVQTGYVSGHQYFKERPDLQDAPDPRTEFGVWENPGIPTRRFYQLAGFNTAIARDLFNETPGFDEDLIYGGVQDLLFGYHIGLIPDAAVVFNREMEVRHIPRPKGDAHLNVGHTWSIVKRKWPEFYADYRENGSR